MARRSKGKLFSSHSRGALNARLRRVIVVSAITLVSLIVLLVVGYSQLMSYLQGDSFRQKMADTLRSSTGAASVELASNLSINGNRVTTEGISVSNLKSIREARASRISAELDRGALFSRKLHIHKLSVEEAVASFVTGATSTPSAAAPKKKAKRKAAAKATATKKKAKSPAKEEKPVFKLRNIELEQLECRDADLHLDHNGKVYQLLGANISATPAPRIGADAWQINAENARLHTPFPFLRDSSVKSATLVYHNGKVDMTECRIMLTPGEMRLKAYYDLKPGSWSADLQVNKGDLHRILNEDWKKRMSGELYGRMTLTGTNGGVETASGSFSVQNGIIEGLPFLSQLPVGNTYPYRSIELEKADYQVIFPYNGDKIKQAWLFDKINLRSRDGSFLVHGHILIGSDRRLGGTLTIGVPKSIAALLPLAPEELAAKLFTAEGTSNDYLWVNMNLSGTIDKPQEDLSIRIATLAGQNLGKFLTDIPKGSASSLLNLLLQQKPTGQKESAPDTPQQPAPASGDIINDATKAAGSLLNSLF